MMSNYLDLFGRSPPKKRTRASKCEPGNWSWKWRNLWVFSGFGTRIWGTSACRISKHLHGLTIWTRKHPICVMWMTFFIPNFNHFFQSLFNDLQDTHTHKQRFRSEKNILVGGFNPSEKYESQLGLSFPIYRKEWSNIQTKLGPSTTADFDVCRFEYSMEVLGYPIVTYFHWCLDEDVLISLNSIPL